MFNFMRLPPLRRLMLMKAITGGGSWSTISGNPVSFTAKAAPLRKLKVAFSPVQDLHGYDAPWPAGGGKNLWDEVYTGIQESSTLVYLAVLVGDGEFTLSTTCPTIQSSANLFLLAGDVSSGASTTVNGVSASTSRTVTSVDGYVTIAYRAYGGVDPRNYKTQLEKGSSATSYAPYSNECPILGWDSLNVEQRGKNLFDPDNLETVDNPLNPSATKYAHTFTKAGTYALRAFVAPSANRYVYAVVKKADGTYGQAVYIVAGKNVYGNTVTITDGQTLIVYNAGSEGINTTKELLRDAQVIVAYSDTLPSAYTPYNPSSRSISITLGQTVYSGTLDLVTGVVTVTHKKVVLDASYMNIQIRNTYVTDGVRRFNSWGFAYTGDKEWFKGTNESTLYCDTLKPLFDGIRSTGNIWITGGQAPSYPSVFALTLPDQTIETPAEADAYMAAHPITIVAELRYPIPIQLTPQEVESLAGDNTMWTDADSLEVTYRSN